MGLTATRDGIEAEDDDRDGSGFVDVSMRDVRIENAGLGGMRNDGAAVVDLVGFRETRA